MRGRTPGRDGASHVPTSPCSLFLCGFSQNSSSSFLSTLVCPEQKTTVSRALSVSVRGLLLPQDIHRLIQEIRSAGPFPIPLLVTSTLPRLILASPVLQASPGVLGVADGSRLCGQSGVVGGQ